MQEPSEQTAAPTPTLLRDSAMVGEWVLDSQASSIRFKTRSMWGIVPVTGVFREFSGNGTIGPDGKVSGTIMVATASIDTRNTRRDAHLRSADFLDSRNAPYIAFTADGVRACGHSVMVTGALTVRGRTRSLVVEATASVPAAGQVLLDAEVGINRADFGVKSSLAGMASVNNTLTIHAVFSRQPVDVSGGGRAARRGPATLNGGIGEGDLQSIADWVEIEALRGEFTDAGMMRDYGRLASLFTPDGVVRIPRINAAAVGRAEIRAGAQRLQGLLEFLVQTTHPGAIQLEGDSASGRAYLCELIRFHDGRSELNYAVYHDRYRRTSDGWKFSERVYEITYLDTSPLAGSAVSAVGKDR